MEADSFERWDVPKTGDGDSASLRPWSKWQSRGGVVEKS